MNDRVEICSRVVVDQDGLGLIECGAGGSVEGLSRVQIKP